MEHVGISFPSPSPVPPPIARFPEAGRWANMRIAGHAPGGSASLPKRRTKGGGTTLFFFGSGDIFHRWRFRHADLKKGPHCGIGSPPGLAMLEGHRKSLQLCDGTAMRQGQTAKRGRLRGHRVLPGLSLANLPQPRKVVPGALACCSASFCPCAFPAGLTRLRSIFQEAGA